jgi:7,8-dihydroneopterin aldolase/epimerase/oxygenase
MDYENLKNLSSSFVFTGSADKPARRIFLKNYRTLVSIGIHAHEHDKKQLVLINVDLYFEASRRAQQDSIESVLDYDFLRAEIERITSGRHFNLQETLCEEILAACLSRAEVLAARVSTEKPEAYSNCDSVGYEVFWRKDFA